MSDEYDDELEESRQEQRPRDLRAQIDELNAKLRDYDTLKEKAARADVLERENAFFKAELPSDLSEARRKAILATAEDATPDGYRKAAVELGFIDAPQPTVPQSELDAIERIANGATGGANGVDPANYEAEVAAARTPEELRAVMAKFGRTPETVE